MSGDSNETERSPEETAVEDLRNSGLAEPTWLWTLGVPTARIAQQMGISPSTVRAHLFQARQRLAADPLVALIARSA